MYSHTPIKSIFSLFLALIILSASNHCVFEDVFTSISNSIFSAVDGETFPNHAGASHNHEDSSEKHEHGQPHQFIVLKLEKLSFNFFLVFDLIIFTPLFFICRLLELLLKVIAQLFTSWSTQNHHRNFISSLSIAPQAPPLIA